jgi:hypothetical protein
MDKEKIEDVASSVKQMMVMLDLMLLEYDVKDLRTMAQDMRSNNAKLSAWPFPETMNKAELQAAQLNTFEVLIKLLETRQEQMRLHHEKPRFIEGNELLKKLGY